MIAMLVADTVLEAPWLPAGCVPWIEDWLLTHQDR